jgi:hypothetical protein
LATISLLKGQYSTKSYFQHSCLVIVSSLHSNVPDRLGIKVLFGSALLTVLTFGLLFLVFGYFTKKWLWSVLLLLISIGFFVAHYESGYEEGKQNQTVYYTSTMPILIRRVGQHDVNLDPWTKEYLGENPKPATTLNQTPCSANTFGLYVCCTAPKKNFKTYRRILKDSIAGNKRYLRTLLTVR